MERAMIEQSTVEGRMVATALRLAAERPWATISLRDIAEAAGVTLADLRGKVASKSAVLVALHRAVDAEVLRKAPRAMPGQSRRDALFDVVMARLDVLTPYKPAIHSIVSSGAPDGIVVRSLLKSQRWMLEAAGIDASGIGGGLRVAGLASVYAATMRTWLAEDDPGLARTMAVLDRRLRKGEGSIKGLEGVCGGLCRLAGLVSDRRRDGASTASAPTGETGTPPGAAAGSAL